MIVLYCLIGVWVLVIFATLLLAVLAWIDEGRDQREPCPIVPINSRRRR